MSLFIALALTEGEVNINFVESFQSFRLGNNINMKYQFVSFVLTLWCNCCRKVKTIYPCVAENSSELSFDAGTVICNGESWKA